MNHFASNSVINFVPNQTCECVQLQWRCCMTMQDFFHMEMPFTRHCGTRIFPMSWGGSHWHHGLVKKTMERRKECFLSSGEAAWQETNTCKYSRFESIESIPIVFVLRVFGANPLHCLYFSQNTKKTTREKFGSLKTTDKRF